MRLLSTLLVLSVVAGACGGTSPATTVAEHAVSGFAHAGPVCPVVTDPPDPACADRPVADALLVVADAAGDPVTEVRTDEDGRFEVALPAGGYTLVPQPVEGLMGTAGPQDFTVGEAAVDLDVAYDTGIR